VPNLEDNRPTLCENWHKETMYGEIRVSVCSTVEPRMGAFAAGNPFSLPARHISKERFGMGVHTRLLLFSVYSHCSVIIATYHHVSQLYIVVATLPALQIT
jgi:hypothetical protein